MVTSGFAARLSNCSTCEIEIFELLGKLLRVHPSSSRIRLIAIGRVKPLTRRSRSRHSAAAFVASGPSCPDGFELRFRKRFLARNEHLPQASYRTFSQ